ncbi:MAG: hypothetical protein ACI9BW_003420, partial [Gammaproteobacteria bacterium]
LPSNCRTIVARNRLGMADRCSQTTGKIARAFLSRGLIRHVGPDKKI